MSLGAGTGTGTGAGAFDDGFGRDNELQFCTLLYFSLLFSSVSGVGGTEQSVNDVVYITLEALGLRSSDRTCTLELCVDDKECVIVSDCSLGTAYSRVVLQYFR